MNRKNRRTLAKKTISILLASMLFLVLAVTYAQQPPPPPMPGITAPAQQPQQPPQANTKVVKLVRAGLLYKRADFDAQILRDSVVFYHQGAYMYCDSAYMYEETNTFEAFGNVRMEQGDSLFVYGDYLHYDGDTRLARLRNHVRMEDRVSTLFTDSLNYDRDMNLGYYFEGGMLVDEQNELTSFWGQYNPDTKESLFSDSVKLVNPDYIIRSDTLLYNTETKIANILGPSVIESDSGYIHTTAGWYNTMTDDAQLFNKSKVFSNDGSKMLTGDTILYNRLTGQGIVHGSMFLQDTIQKTIVQGNYGLYNEKTEYALATDSAFVVEYSQRDSLFLHGDTLIMFTDTLGREVKAFHNVRFFRNDLQGICDSMHYVSNDSILRMYRDPVLWNESNQILGEQIDIFLNDSTIDKAIVRNYALTIQQRYIEGQFNQMGGRDMTALFRDGALHHILVEGNAESLYYTVEKDSTVIGLNKTESAYLSIDLLEGKVDRVKLWSATKAETTPLSILKPEESKLKGFLWLDYLRPKNRYDIFRRNSKSSDDSEVEHRQKFIRD